MLVDGPGAESEVEERTFGQECANNTLPSRRLQDQSVGSQSIDGSLYLDPDYSEVFSTYCDKYPHYFDAAKGSFGINDEQSPL